MTTTQARPSPGRVRLDNVRIAFCQNLWEPGSSVQGEGKPRYSSTFLFEPESPQHKTVKSAIVAAAREKWRDKADDILRTLKAKDQLCVHDGNLKPDYDGFKDMMYLSAASPGNKKAPTVIDGRGDRPSVKEEDGVIYPGCYVSVSVEIWAQDDRNGKRINAKLRGVMFMKDGDSFGGSAQASRDEFDDVEVSEEVLGEAEDVLG